MIGNRVSGRKIRSRKQKSGHPYDYQQKKLKFREGKRKIDHLPSLMYVL
jgi:hypothetical protein